MRRALEVRHGGRAVAYAILFLALAAFLWVTRDYEILGMDTYPGIAAGILRSLSDLVRIFTSPDVVGRVPYPLHGFYRPFVMLSFGTDHLLYGTDARGYFVTQALLFGTCGALLYELGRRLLGPSSIGPLVALIVFLLAPINVETLAVVARRSEMLCAIFAMLAIGAELVRSDRGARGPGVVPALLTLLAMIAKTTAIAIVPALFVLLLLRSREPTFAARVRAAIVAIVPHVLAVAVAFALQLAILGQMGGHVTSRVTGAIDRLPWALAGFARLLLVPQPALRDSAVTWLLLGALALGLAASAALLLVLARREVRDIVEPVAPTVAGSVGWILGAAALYGAVGLLQGWYMFVPTLAYALLFGALCDALARAGQSASAPLRSTALATLAAAALWVAWEARYSMLLGAYPSVPRASALVHAYLADLRSRIADAPDGTVVIVPPPPSRVPAVPGEPTLEGPILIPEYALASWAEAEFPDRRFVVDSRRSDAALEPPPPGVLKLVFRP